VNGCKKTNPILTNLVTSGALKSESLCAFMHINRLLGTVDACQEHTDITSITFFVIADTLSEWWPMPNLSLIETQQTSLQITINAARMLHLAKEKPHVYQIFRNHCRNHRRHLNCGIC
jgi:hypothetical protein